MTISSAIDKIYFSMGSEYEFYLSLLFDEEIDEETFELNEAWRTVNNHGIKITTELLEKKRVRENNRIPEPVRFIDRPRFYAVDTEDLPF